MRTIIFTAFVIAAFVIGGLAVYGWTGNEERTGMARNDRLGASTLLTILFILLVLGASAFH